MKILVVYYTRTNNTKKIANKIAETLNADIDMIIDKKDRTRIIIGWVIAGRDAMTNRLTEIEYKKNPKDYDIVILGTPVWAGTVSPAVRTYLTQNKCEKVAFFCTCGGGKGKAFNEMEKLSNKPEAALEIKENELDTDETNKKIADFCAAFFSNKI